MRPRLRQDVRFAEGKDGDVLVHGDHGSCTLRGRGAYPLLTRLAPLLTGERTVEDLTRGLPAATAGVVTRLVDALAAQDFVIDARPDRPHGLTEAETRLYAAEIGFVGHALDSPAYRFERVRRTRLVVAADGPAAGVLAGALVEAALTAGWRDVLVAGAAPGPVADAARRARRDPAQSVRTAPAGTDPFTGEGPPGAVVLQVASDPAVLVAGCRAAGRTGAALGQALLRPAEAWLTGVGEPGVTDAESGWLRLTDADAGGDVAALLTGAVPALLAGRLVLAAFSHLTGLDAPRGAAAPAPALVRVDLHSLDSTVHRVTRHPAAGAGADRSATAGGPAVRERVAELAALPPVPAADLLRRTAPLIDARTGLLASLGEDDLPQVPLAMCRAALPAGRAGAGGLLGWGADRTTARARAAAAALAVHGAAVTADRADREGRDVWGVEADTGRPRPVPAAALRAAAAGAGGVAAGPSWRQALAAALRARCEARLAAGLPPTTPDDAAPADPAPADAPAGRAGDLRRLLAAAGAEPAVRRLPVAPGLHAFAFLAAGRTLAVTCAASADAALADGYERVLAGRQTGSAPPPAGAAPWPADDDADVAALAGELRRTGGVPVAVPLGDDPAAARVLPFTVAVVMADD